MKCFQKLQNAKKVFKKSSQMFSKICKCYKRFPKSFWKVSKMRFQKFLKRLLNIFKIYKMLKSFKIKVFKCFPKFSKWHKTFLKKFLKSFHNLQNAIKDHERFCKSFSKKKVGKIQKPRIKLIKSITSKFQVGSNISINNGG